MKNTYKFISHSIKMLAWLFAIGCSLLTNNTWAQQNKIDSLTNLLKPSIEDTNQARIHLKLANAYSNSDYDKAMEELVKAYTLNKKLNYYRGLVTCTNIFGILNLICNIVTYMLPYD